MLSSPLVMNVRGYWKKYIVLLMFVVISLFCNTLIRHRISNIGSVNKNDNGNYEYQQVDEEERIIHRILRVGRILQSPWNANNPPNNGGVNPFIPGPWDTYSPVPPPVVLAGPEYQKQILTQRDIRPQNNASRDDDAIIAAPNDDGTDPRTIALNAIILTVAGFFIWIIIITIVVSRVKSKSLQIAEEKRYEEEMELGHRMVSVGTQWDDSVIPLIPVAYKNPETSNMIGFQMNSTISSTVTASSKLPPIRKKLKVRKSADGSIRSAVIMSQSSLPTQNTSPMKSTNKNKITPPLVVIGTLNFKCQRGSNIKSGHSLFGQADPYATIRIDGQEKSTRVIPSGGKNPVWDDEFTFDVYREDVTVEIDVLDKETTGPSRHMASMKHSMLEWIKLGKFEGELPLFDKFNRPEGTIVISVAFSRLNVDKELAQKVNDIVVINNSNNYNNNNNSNGN